jgi:hypothetical protein
MTRWDHHPVCPRCGELADECTCPNPAPLGSMTVTPPEGPYWHLYAPDEEAAGA